MEHTQALKYQWQNSVNNQLLLRAVNIDTRNLVSIEQDFWWLTLPWQPNLSNMPMTQKRSHCSKYRIYHTLYMFLTLFISPPVTAFGPQESLYSYLCCLEPRFIGATEKWEPPSHHQPTATANIISTFANYNCHTPTSKRQFFSNIECSFFEIILCLCEINSDDDFTSYIVLSWLLCTDVCIKCLKQLSPLSFSHIQINQYITNSL